VLQSELFAVAALPPAPAAIGLLPLRVAPQNGEALASWILRLSVALRLSPLALGRMAFGIDADVDVEWWRRPSTETLARIAKRTGISTDALAAMTFAGSASARDDETPQRFCGRHSSAPSLPRNRSDRRINICPQCLAEDPRGYLRLLWTNGWAAICPEHRTVLAGRCPSCRCVLRAAGVNARRPIDPAVCRRCGAMLASVAGDGANPATLRLQELLVAGKQSNRTELPGVGMLDWSTTMALVDVLLGMVWIDIPGRYRDRLFARIANDLGLGKHKNIVWASNYGGLVILAWLLDDLPTRLPAIIAILHAPRLDRLLARVPDLSSEIGDRLRVILARADAPSPREPWSWCNWIRTLPETGDDLRERALSERYKLRRRRLFALAAVRDGTPVEAAAKNIGVTRQTLCRWLQEGEANGLEAALERPRRGSQLSGAQAEALGKWIATDRARQRRRVVINEALTQFGIALSPDQASRLLRVHRTKPGRRHRPWKPKSRRTTQVAGSTHDPAPGL
jgi:transposase